MTLYLSPSRFYGIMEKDSCEINSEVEYFLDVEGAVGSNPSSCTIMAKNFLFLAFLFKEGGLNQLFWVN